MIWRRSVQARLVEHWSPTEARFVTLQGKAFDPQEARLITFGWSLESLAGQEVWRRLAQGDFGPEGLRRCLIVKGQEEELVQELHLCLAPSEKHLFLLLLDPDGTLAEKLNPEDDEICCAWAPRSGLLAMGMATEQAWDAMAGALSGGTDTLQKG